MSEVQVRDDGQIRRAELADYGLEDGIIKLYLLLSRVASRSTE